MDLPRKTLLAQYHIGAKRLFGTDEDLRRSWLEQQIGHRSAAECTDAGLSAAVRELRRLGALDRPARGGAGGGIDRPTDTQWARLAILAKERGWQGLADPRLKAFVVRTAKISSPRFLTRLTMTRCITGMERWASQEDPAHAV